MYDFECKTFNYNIIKIQLCFILRSLTISVEVKVLIMQTVPVQSQMYYMNICTNYELKCKHHCDVAAGEGRTTFHYFICHITSK